MLNRLAYNKDINRGAVDRTEDSFEFSTSAFQLLTGDTAENGILYLKNLDLNKNLHIDSITLNCVSAVEWKMYKNDTAGTLISEGVSGLEINRNFSIDTNASADVWCATGAGAALTRSGGALFALHISEGNAPSIEMKGSLILTQNDSITITAANQTLTGINTCIARIHGYYKTPII